MFKKIKIGIIGGSGLYEFLTPAFQAKAGARTISVTTPFGKPSDRILLFEYASQKIAFLPRHGKQHRYPPHKINYRANLYALKKLGVEKVIAPCAVGSLRPKISPGVFVIVDQFIDRTKARLDTYFDGPKTVHISMAQPYCPQLRKLAVKSCVKLKIPFQQKGTAVIIEGPRFCSKAESSYYAKIGDVINMTQYPEVVLARELEMCYLNISLVTDYDAGLKGRGDIEPVTAQQVIKTFKQNSEKLKKLILSIIKNMPSQRRCPCGSALNQAGL